MALAKNCCRPRIAAAPQGLKIKLLLAANRGNTVGLGPAWAGGMCGYKLIAALPLLLASNGLCYLVLEQVNQPN